MKTRELPSPPSSPSSSSATVPKEKTAQKGETRCAFYCHAAPAPGFHRELHFLNLGSDPRKGQPVEADPRAPGLVWQFWWPGGGPSSS